MADEIVYIDGFDHLSAAQSLRRWGVAYAGAVAGRFGGQAAQLTNANACEKAFAAGRQAYRVGFAVRLTAVAGALRVMRLRDGVTEQVDLGFTAARQLSVTRNGTVLGSSTQSLVLNQWYHVEWYVVIADSISAGQCRVRLDESEVINLAATTDTKNGTSTSADRLVMTGAGSSAVEIDDLVVTQMDNTTTPAWLGDHRVITGYPSGNGNYSQFDGSDGNSTDNYLLVDEQSTINDADYVESDVSGERDSYAMGDLGVTPTAVSAVQITASAQKGDAGARTGKLFFRLSGTDYDSPSAFTPSASQGCHHYLAALSPATSSAWTAAEVNGMECGVKVES